ncbi:DUF5700 domain-containing putative Zn-dependent protease [Steroidobacter cummioxidans]|uniref:DUF5700 domain-containing putative Zn-dependent protease n=1 Tax=Steroidobacter cummioxidans TaxID=1803913 RepID=UPI000E3184DF|nr:DUF5700 domain-containing putative Zn-dependent protease [Steroidobacter cummioxidans]
MRARAVTCSVIAATWALMSGCATAPPGNPTTLHFDYAGAEVLIEALDEKSLTAEQFARLQSTHGLTAMVDNVSRYIPDATRARFESDLRTFLETREEPRYGKYRVWSFNQAWDAREQVTTLIADLRLREGQLVKQVLTTLQPFQPDTGPLTINVYFVAGGVSDGFVTESGQRPELYVNLARAQGDAAGVIANLTHEVYHVMQQTAARQIPELKAKLDNLDELPPPDQLVAHTLWEGTANYAADPLQSSDTGPYIEMWRSMYERNMTPERIAENFALFDSLLGDLREQRISWSDAYAKGFAGPESRLYFVGYEMARVIAEHCGRPCIGQLFQQAPVEFFRQYIALYKAHPNVRARFAADTEQWMESH